jgi:hypothetical protein
MPHVETVDLPDDRWSAAGNRNRGDPMTEHAALRPRSADDRLRTA